MFVHMYSAALCGTGPLRGAARPPAAPRGREGPQLLSKRASRSSLVLLGRSGGPR